MDFIVSHMAVIVSFLLIVSEALSAVMQLLFPTNKGFSGILSGIIKMLQSIKASEAPIPPAQ